MAVRQNRIIACLAAGRRAVGIRQRRPDPGMVEMCAETGADFVYLDCEHGAFDLRDVAETARAVDVAGMTLLTRVPTDDPALIGRFLNAGVQGIIVPHVSTADQARRVVRACLFPPEGERSLVTSRSVRGIGDDYEAFMRAANAQISVSVQLEDLEAARNAPEIAAVHGISYFTIGKQDLRADMGLPRQGRLQDEVEAIVDGIATAVHAAGAKLKDEVMTVLHVDDLVLRGVRAAVVGVA